MIKFRAALIAERPEEAVRIAHLQLKIVSSETTRRNLASVFVDVANACERVRGVVRVQVTTSIAGAYLRPYADCAA